MFFRDAIVSDLPFIISVYNSTIASRMVTADTEPVKTEDKLDWFHHHEPANRPLWIVTDEKKHPVGWVSFQDFYGRPAYRGTAEISIYIDEQHRGKGYGKKMLQYAISRCSTLGIHTLLGFIFAHNANSLHVFLQHGFEEWGLLKDVAIMDNQPYSLKILGLKIPAV